ncbi:MAG TPA: glycosyltransferase family 2 protein [Myxococcales bacterium]|nr:glycosyltransferase family 2 protein [Myxococcales bacterium]
MLISILLPAKDASATLPDALRGVLGQEGAPPFEVVCVDDASVDATPALLAAAARADPRVRVIRGTGSGLTAALNLGLSHCRGELIARMDADDLVHPDRLRLQAEMLAKDASLGAAGCLVHCFPAPLSPGLARLEDWLNATVTREQCRNGRFVEAPLVHPSATFRREALAAGWEDHGWAEDWDLLLRLCEQGWQLAKVPLVLLHWRDSPERLTRTGAAYREEAMLRLRAHYLARGPLRGRAFDLWGAGPTGKRLARELEVHGLRPRAFYDVDARKRLARGRPVLTEPHLPPPGEAMMLCAVGAAGARDEIRSVLEARGYREGPDFLFAA